MRSRTVLSFGVIVALIVAVWAALSSGDEPPATTITTTVTTLPTMTTVETTTTTATTATAPETTVTTVPPTTTDQEARVEEVRLILEDLYFRWFDAIYRNDEEAVREAIATERYLEDFRRAVQTREFPRAPERTDIRVEDLEILRDTPDCLVTFSTIDVRGWLGPEGIVTGVNVLLPLNDQWRLGTAWINRNDLWQTDCDIEPGL